MDGGSILKGLKRKDVERITNMKGGRRRDRKQEE